MTIGEVRVWLQPAGHVLGSAQVAMEWQRQPRRGQRRLQARMPDPTCLPFEPIPCDVFVTEATFALPVFRHPPAAERGGRSCWRAVHLFPERTHVVGAYALGQGAARDQALLRDAGYDRPIYLHGAMLPLCAAYERLGGRRWGPLLPATAQGAGPARPPGRARS